MAPSTTPPPAELAVAFAQHTIAIGQTQVVTGTGFQPGEVVAATMYSSPVQLGSQAADSSGRVTFAWVIARSTSVGAHEVVLTGAQSGSVRAAFVVSGDLPATGAPLGPALWAGALLLVAGTGTVAMTRRTRR